MSWKSNTDTELRLYEEVCLYTYQHLNLICLEYSYLCACVGFILQTEHFTTNIHLYCPQKSLSTHQQWSSNRGLSLQGSLTRICPLLTVYFFCMQMSLQVFLYLCVFRCVAARGIHGPLLLSACGRQFGFLPFNGQVGQEEQTSPPSLFVFSLTAIPSPETCWEAQNTYNRQQLKKMPSHVDTRKTEPHGIFDFAAPRENNTHTHADYVKDASADLQGTLVPVLGESCQLSRTLHVFVLGGGGGFRAKGISWSAIYLVNTIVALLTCVFWTAQGLFYV